MLKLEFFPIAITLLFPFINNINAQNLFEATGVECIQNILEITYEKVDDDTETLPPAAQNIKIGSKNYIIPIGKRVNWYQAADICHFYNAQLANIEDEDEMNAITEYLDSKTIYYSFWISGNSLRKGGEWVWGDTGRQMNYTKWLPFVQRGSTNNEHCVQIMTYKGRHMNHIDCRSSFQCICVEKTNKIESQPSIIPPFQPFVKIQKKYYILDNGDKVNWFQAGDLCRSKNSQLANIENESEMNAIYNYISNKNYDGWFWISGNDLRKEGRFVWGDTGKPMAYAKWQLDDPNNYGNNEHCVLLKREGDFKMLDINCNNTYNYICVY